MIFSATATTARVLSMGLLALMPLLSLHGCAPPAGGAEAFLEGEVEDAGAGELSGSSDTAEESLGHKAEALPCRDCEEPTPTGPYRPPVKSLPWAYGIKPGKKVDVKFHAAQMGFSIYLTALSTTWERTDQTKLSTVRHPKFQFSIEKVAPSTCRINMFFDFAYYSYVGNASFNEDIHGDYFCYTAPHADESDGNNGGFELAVPELLMTVWAKREDRIRIDFMQYYDNPEKIIEIDTDENS